MTLVESWGRSVQHEHSHDCISGRVTRRAALQLGAGAGVAAVAAGTLLNDAREIFALMKNEGELRSAALVISKSVGDTKWTMIPVKAKDIAQYLSEDAHDTHTVIQVNRLLRHIQSPEAI